MGVGDYGMASTFLSWASIFSIICTMNLGYTIGRAKLDYPGKLKKYVGTMQMFSLAIVVLMAFIAIPFLNTLSEWLELDKDLIFILLIYVMANSVTGFAQSLYRFEYRYKENIGITIFTTIATFVFTLALLPVFQERMYLGKILGTVLPVVIVSVIIIFNQIRTKNLCLVSNYLKYGLIISIPLIGHTISLNILAQSDRIMITQFCGTEATGIYSIAYTYAVLINLIIDSINNAYNPWFHDNYFTGNVKEIKEIVRPLVMLGCVIGLGCIMIAPEAIMFLGGEPYMEGIWVVIPVALGVIVQYIYSHYVIIEMHLKKTIYVSIGTAIAAVSNLVLNAIFIPIYGFVAAGYTTLVSYLVLLVIHFIVTRKKLNIHLYSDRFMFGSIIIMLFLGILSGLLYQTVVPRYILLTAYVAAYCIINRKYVKRMILGFFNRK